MNPYKTAAYYTLGCKLNFAESSTIARQLSEKGLARVDFDQKADVYVVNTCSVTENADRKCRNIIRKAKQTNPSSKVIVIGCYAQLKPKAIASIDGVDMVLGANEKFNIAEFLQEDQEDVLIKNEHIKETREFVPGFSSGDRTRTFLKVQDGCDYFCSFCTIPLARGRSRSASIEETLAEARKAAQTEAKEIVLTGVNIGDFGSGTNESFFDLVKQLDSIDGVERFRISSIEPNLLSNDIIEFVAGSEKFMPHFHIPLQSGSNVLLKKMRRRYDSHLYANRIQTIKELMPNCCIGVDVIVGFPGESDELFQETYDFLNTLPISYLHVFTYSERANTTAVRMDETVPMATRNERSKMLRILSQKKKRAFYESQVGQERPVLWESSDVEGMMHGFTDNYLKVSRSFEANKCNTIDTVELNELDSSGKFNAPIEVLTTA
ncbi:MAG: tRNA (N(6)-L-threonylcarbamoyladenosine(37)-C(2))-methylthiotransferase MtaB [Bacteroidota bacterium]